MRSSIKGVLPEWWDLPGQDGEEDPVGFFLQPLNGLAWTAVLMGSYSAETGEVDGSGIVKAFKLGVKNWRNIENADSPGNQLAYSIQSMTKIPPGWIMAAGNRVLEISRISEDDSKN